MTNLAELFSYMQAGATIITPNNRSAMDLQRLYAKNACLQERPRCYPYELFLQNLYTALRWKNPKLNFPVLLTASQVIHLWSAILKEQLGEPLNVGLVEEVREAWSRCQKWLLSTDKLLPNYNQQIKDFQSWSKLFEKALEKHSAITSELLVPFFINSELAPVPHTLIWYCFDEYTPAQKALHNFLEAKGSIIEHRDIENYNYSSFYYKAEDEASEYAQIILWIEEKYQAGAKNLAVVVPELESKAQIFERYFKKLPEEIGINISLGKALAKFPLVSHALCWLNLDNLWFSHQQISLLLYSPYLGFSSREFLTRAELWQDSTVLQENMVSGTNFMSLLKTKAPRLWSLLTKLNSYPQKASLTRWVEIFKERLQILGFPGETSLNSVVFQCYQRFLEVFDEFLALGLISKEFTQQEALTAFEALANQTIFQAKKTDATVHILGLLEASGCLFDNIWVTSMSAETLPEKTQFSAFIPIEIQKKESMPHSSTSRELILAKKIVERLKKSSRSIIFSYPKLTEAKPNLPCSLLSDLADYQAQLVPEQALQELEIYQESYKLELSLDEKIQGGTSLLANQAKCPFKAFAAHRLHIRRGVSRSEGLDPSERGLLVHNIMEKIWQRIQTQAKLLALSLEELEDLIYETITQALKPYQTQRPYSFSPLIQSMEVTRLAKLIQAALNWEKSRPEFTIEALEKEFIYSLANISFKLRIDRIDKVEDKLWVIDYKTSLPTSLPWKEQRPTEPQLLVYALIDETINTLIFAGLKQGQLSLKGLSENKYEVAGIQVLKDTEDWWTKRKLWQEQLEALAIEFKEGEIAPKPLSGTICQLCDFQTLCRLTY